MWADLYHTVSVILSIHKQSSEMKNQLAAVDDILKILF